MIIVVADCERTGSEYRSLLASEGVATKAYCSSALRQWLNTDPAVEEATIDAFLLDDMPARSELSEKLRRRSEAALIALTDRRALDRTLELFAAGIDDVVAKPYHPKEIVARVAAIQRRGSAVDNGICFEGIRVFRDGRDAEVAGSPMLLPRRERNILEHLVVNRGRFVPKAQLFRVIYGMTDEHVQENVIESHVSKLRKKLKMSLSYDPVVSQRYVGYGVGVSKV